MKDSSSMDYLTIGEPTVFQPTLATPANANPPVPGLIPGIGGRMESSPSESVGSKKRRAYEPETPGLKTRLDE
jgi:hypothetical protein